MRDSQPSHAERGPIIVARHGKPQLDRTAGPRLDWKAYQDWWSRYEQTPLNAGQTPPADLVEAVADADIVLASALPRALMTAQAAAPGASVEQHAVFNEANLPPPQLPYVRYLPKTWNVLARTAWLAGHKQDGEGVRTAKQRARSAAELLHETADGQKVFLAAHGWFNRMLKPELKRLGWTMTRDGGDGYWSFRRYDWKPGEPGGEG